MLRRLRLEEITSSQNDFLNSIGMELQDSFNKSGYDMFLIKNNNFSKSLRSDYQVAINKEGRDFTSVNQQTNTNYVKTFLPIHDIVYFIDCLRKWNEKYGRISMASHSTKKMKQYELFMKRYKFKYIKFDNPFMDNFILVIV